jgi:hypothetical protein
VAQNRAYEEIHERILASLSGCLAVHEEFLCREEEPCVVICKGCNSRNIVAVLVHESIHHVLLWLNDDFGECDKFDEISKMISERGFRI